jgi:hydroxyethylthiazole kinase
MKEELIKQIGGTLEDLRQKKPLIHHLTNYVTVNDCANIVLAIGASPIMADDIEEVETITAMASALVLNIGTLNQRTIISMVAAGKKANQRNIPVVLDPVGAGASELRNRTVVRLLDEVKIDILRGNMSEIRFISGLKASTKGVDASEDDIARGNTSGMETAKNLAGKLNCVVAITGATDLISDGTRCSYIQNGHPMLSRVTGTGCMSTSLVGAFAGVTTDYFLAASAGILCMGITGEIAFAEAGTKGTGSFHTAIIDSISRLDNQTIMMMAQIHAE